MKKLYTSHMTEKELPLDALQVLKQMIGKSFNAWMRIPLMNCSNILGEGEVEISPDPECGKTRIRIHVDRLDISINVRDIQRVKVVDNQNILIDFVGGNTARIMKVDED